MKLFFFALMLLTIVTNSLACEVKQLEKVKPEISKKLSKADIKTIPCESLQTALSSYGKSYVTGGRRLEGKDTLYEKSENNICKNPEWIKKISAANAIDDVDTRVIITAAILDDAGEYVARDMVLNNPKVKPCQ